MGKSLIIKGADFSTNGILETVELDITSLVDASTGDWFPQRAVNAFVSTSPSSNTQRCAVVRLSIGSLVPNLSQYQKIRVDVKNGFDFVLAMCRDSANLSTATSWFRLDGTNTSNRNFTWVTDKQYAEVDVSAEMYITGNFRYDDNTTTFERTTKFSDIASIKLIG